MVSSKFLFIFLFLISTTSLPDVLEKKPSPLKPIISKQALYNIRFVSQDSSFTIFQKHSGGLFLSTNYKVAKLIDNPPYTQYNVFGNQDSKYILISEKKEFSKFFNPNQENKIYKLKYGSDELEEVGIGSLPQFHLKGNFISYFSPSTNSLIIKRLLLPSNEYEIKLNTPANPYFRPKALMMNPEEVLILEQNRSGLQIVKQLNLESKKETILLKTESYDQTLDICLKESALIIFTSHYLNSALEKTQIKIKKPGKNNFEIIYESKLNDLGQLACHSKAGSLLFIKNFGTSQKTYFDVSEINIQEKSVKRLTEEGYITSIFEMDGRLMAINNGEQMLLLGENSLKNDSIPSARTGKSDTIKK